MEKGKMPKKGDKVTQEEIDGAIIDGAINRKSFSGDVVPDTKGWHQGPPKVGDDNSSGLFEGWTIHFGYQQGFAIYGGVLVGPGKVPTHIYYLPSKDKCILLNPNEEPSHYGVQ
jgi:hypothetical protein